MPIVLSLLLNEVTNKRLKNGIQTIIYIPHFTKEYEAAYKAAQK